MIRLRRDRAQNYYYLFDHETGIAVRWGKDNREPFWRKEGPELLDISITNYCENSVTVRPIETGILWNFHYMRKSWNRRRKQVYSRLL